MRADARRNRERLLAAAEETFAAEGIGVPIDEIARRAGVGPGTVYRHFPTKQALFQAIVSARLESLKAKARSLAGADDPGAAFFELLGTWLVEGIAKRDLIDALAADGYDVKHANSAAAQEFHEAVGALMTRAQRAGAVRDDVGISDLLALLTGTSMALRSSGDADLARRLTSVLCDGLRASR